MENKKELLTQIENKKLIIDIYSESYYVAMDVSLDITIDDSIYQINIPANREGGYIYVTSIYADPRTTTITITLTGPYYSNSNSPFKYRTYIYGSGIKNGYTIPNNYVGTTDATKEIILTSSEYVRLNVVCHDEPV